MIVYIAAFALMGIVVSAVMAGLRDATWFLCLVAAFWLGRFVGLPHDR